MHRLLIHSYHEPDCKLLTFVRSNLSEIKAALAFNRIHRSRMLVLDLDYLPARFKKVRYCFVVRRLFELDHFQHQGEFLSLLLCHARWELDLGHVYSELRLLASEHIKSKLAGCHVVAEVSWLIVVNLLSEKLDVIAHLLVQFVAEVKLRNLV